MEPRFSSINVGQRFSAVWVNLASASTDRRWVARPASLCLVRLPEVKAICGLSRSSIYMLIRNGRFPPPVAISGRAHGWVRHEVEGWVAERIRAGRQR